MNRFLYISVIVFALFTSCESNLPVSDRVISKDNNLNAEIYPPEVNKLGIQQLYDKTKWYLYCIFCDKHVQFTYYSKVNKIVTFGELPLMLDKVDVRADTVIIDFMFYYDNVQLNNLNIDNSIYYGILYRGQSDSVICYMTQGILNYMSFRCKNLNDCQTREVVPLQPEVIDYIRKNKNKLDPWFRKEAIKRGVISE